MLWARHVHIWLTTCWWCPVLADTAVACTASSTNLNVRMLHDVTARKLQRGKLGRLLLPLLPVLLWLLLLLWQLLMLLLLLLQPLLLVLLLLQHVRLLFLLAGCKPPALLQTRLFVSIHSPAQTDPGVSGWGTASGKDRGAVQCSAARS